MFDFTLCNIVGYAAAVCMVLGYMPQAIYTIRTRDTDGIALPTFLLMGLGGFLFIIQGILTENWPLTVTNCITTASSMIVFGIKVYNDFFRKLHSVPALRPGVMLARLRPASLHIVCNEAGLNFCHGYGHSVIFSLSP